ncbi:MAG: hypothetical protein ACC662_05730, partial [Planctomycetota bacterium]
LSSGAAEDPARIAERLEDPETRRAAEAAAPPGSEMATLLAAGNGSAEDLARAFCAARNRARNAERARRRPAAARAAVPTSPVPPRARMLLERYFARLDANSGGR